MAKVLVIRKVDKTVHKAQLGEKAFLQSYNHRLPAAQKFTIEEMEESEADKLPYIDKSYVTAGQAVSKVKELETTLAGKDSEIETLRKQLEAFQAASHQKPAAPMAAVPPAQHTPPPAPAAGDPGGHINQAAADNIAKGTNAEDDFLKDDSNKLVNVNTMPDMTTASTAAQPIPGKQAVNYEKMSNDSLIKMLGERNITHDPAATKKVFVKLLQDADNAKK